MRILRILTMIACFVFPSLRAYADNIQLRDVDGGWHEAVLIVQDASSMATFFETVAGWRVIDSGPLPDDMVRYLAAGATGATGEYALVKAPDFDQGWVRIIELHGVERKITRSNGQAWDTGGVFSLMTRSANIERNLADAERAGWTAFNDPYDFGFGDLELRNIVLRGPAGVNLAIYEWIAPKRDDAPPEGAVSKAFNSMQMVRDIAAARAFYVDTLGFDVIAEGAFIDPEPRATNFALPLNLATEIPRDYVILIPGGGDNEAGRIELMQFNGLEGRDLSGRSALSNFGISTLMFPVSSLQKTVAQIERAGIDFVRRPTLITLPSVGRVEALTISSPEGAFLTFFERKESQVD